MIVYLNGIPSFPLCNRVYCLIMWVMMCGVYTIINTMGMPCCPLGLL